MTTEREPILIDVISDVVCPWCFIGKRRLEKAVTAFDTPLTVRWRPYQLDATIPPGGKDRKAYLEAKFGSSERIRQIHANVASVGTAEGIDFAFDRIKVSPNTLDAHRLIRWSDESGSQDAIVEALFRAYFLDGRDIGDHAVLADIASGNGIDGQGALSRLASDEDRETVEAEVAAAHRIGVTGVPTFILGNRYGLVGAQPAGRLRERSRRSSSSGKRNPTPPPERD
jgi:predicted DsbA family dithiol-disulfide isomerase